MKESRQRKIRYLIYRAKRLKEKDKFLFLTKIRLIRFMMKVKILKI
jgi:hypothetical protein